MLFTLRKLNSTVSTNDDAQRAAEEGAAAGTVCWALEQHAGRGRRGRQWYSPPGNLYFSVVLRPTQPAQDYVHFSFAAALAISDAINAILPHGKIELKWPNDVLVNGEKISGVLLEAGQDWLVVGMGINVALSPQNPLYPATSLKAQGLCTEIEPLLTSILTALGAWLDVYETSGFGPIRDAWIARAKLGYLRVRKSANHEIEGQFGTLDDMGSLELLLSDGSTQKVSTGDVFM